jgi:hypothetical protein
MTPQDVWNASNAAAVFHLGKALADQLAQTILELAEEATSLGRLKCNDCANMRLAGTLAAGLPSIIYQMECEMKEGGIPLDGSELLEGAIVSMREHYVQLLEKGLPDAR